MFLFRAPISLMVKKGVDKRKEGDLMKVCMVLDIIMKMKITISNCQMIREFRLLKARTRITTDSSHQTSMSGSSGPPFSHHHHHNHHIIIIIIIIITYYSSSMQSIIIVLALVIIIIMMYLDDQHHDCSND